MPDKRRQGQPQQLTYFSHCFAEQECGEIHRCSRICSGQSTQKPQDSIGIGSRTVNDSIKSTYFLQISISFNKSIYLLWDRWSIHCKFFIMSYLRKSST
jgi:hypothetical protein